MSEITECESAVEKMLMSLGLFEQINAVMPDVLYLFDLVEQRNLYINKKDILGYGAEELTEVGDNFLKKVIHPNDLDQVKEHLKDCLKLKDGEILKQEFRMKHAPTGKYLWFLSRDMVFCRDSNGIPRVILGTARDISTQKRLEEKLVMAERLFSQFAENSDFVIWIASGDKTKLFYVNHAYEQIWGRSRQSLLENPKSWFEAVYPEDREDASEFITRDIRELYLKKEYRILRPDGTMRWIRDGSFPIRNVDGNTIYVAGIAEDITEEKQLRKEAEYRLKQIIQADKLASLGEVVAGVAHEINNPNSFIAYNIPLLEQTWKSIGPIAAEYALSHPEWKVDGLSMDELSEDMKDIIEDLRTGSDRINKVIKNLKDFARMDEPGNPSSVQINEVVSKTMVIVGSQVRKLAAKIELNLGKNLPKIEGYFSKLEQVVANLLVNAAHSIDDKDRGTIAVTTRWMERLQSVLIEVEDNGRGMSLETAQHIFDPFFTTRRASGGTGLGLSVSYGLVQEHGGVIGLLSRPGLGSRFSVYLPADRSISLDIQPTVLCVDDDTLCLNMLQAQFSRVKKCSAGLHDPKVVLSYLEEHPEVYVVLSDLVMPNLNGWELFARVKERFPLLPFILYSGDPDALEAKPEGVPSPDYMLKKPFEIELLVHIMTTIAVLPPPNNQL